MARNKERDERVKALVAAMLAEEETEGLGGRRETINDIEDAMVRIADQVAREVGIQKLAGHAKHLEEEPRCPDCGHAGEHRGEQTRDVITRRGEVPLTEAKYRCPKCRRHFFPSEQGAGA